MRFQKTTRQTAFMSAILCGTAASADVTAQQVWDNWSAQTEIYGEGFTTGEQIMSGDTLTIADVRIEFADSEAAVLAEVGDIVLTENGDGTVSVTMDQSYPVRIDLTPQFGDPSTLSLIVAQIAMEMTVSGDPDGMIYDISADEYSISVDSLAGEAADEINLQDATVALRNISGNYSVITENLTRIAYSLEVGDVSLDLMLREVDADGFVILNGALSDMTMFANISTPIEMDLDADQPPFSDGLAFEGGYTFGDLRYSMDVDAEGEAIKASVTAETGGLDFSMDLDGLAYKGETTGVVVNALIANELPFPLEASLGQYGFELLAPLSQGEGEPRTARVAFNLTDLTISDAVWNLFDPTNILPRDPVTIALALDAGVTPFFDFLDPAQQQAAMMSDVPGELDNLEVTEFTVRGAGAEITGAGAFTFDNSDLETFDGFPRPEGEINFAINGVNGLIDNLIQMGLIPQDQAMMPRMMMGMFTTPVGDDMLTSTIEVNTEGHVLANGQRLR